MSTPLITVEDLSKKYKISHQASRPRYRSLREEITQRTVELFRPRRSGDQAASPATEEEFWALKQINFQVEQGDVLGIIGRNGAGKSTLLKVLSRITEPTTGRIHLRGRIASLLEVGTGFHPELTGRENIYLNGAILGMSRVEIDKKFDEIVEFAEVERFLDTAVKHYSSGMYVRLAFAVAAHLEPEILIIDEVLAVGDVQFQKKCLGKMGQVAKGGRTVLFVSHNMSTVLQLTSKCILLEQGAVSFEGSPSDVVQRYLSSSERVGVTVFKVENAPRKWVGTGAAKILELRFDRALPIFGAEEDFSFVATVKLSQQVPKIRFSMTVFAADGTPVGSSFGEEVHGGSAGEIRESEVRLPAPRLAPGFYYCGVGVGKGDNTVGHVDFDVVLDTLHFEVQSQEGESGTSAAWHQAWGRVRFARLAQSAVVLR